MKLFIWLFFASSIAVAEITTKMSGFLDGHQKTIQALNGLGFSCEQRNLVIDRFIDSLLKLHPASNERDRLPLRKIIDGYLASDVECRSETTSMVNAISFEERFETTLKGELSNYQHINFLYEGHQLPLTMYKFAEGSVRIHMRGIAKYFPIYTQNCLELTLDKNKNELSMEIDSLNPGNVACPLPAGKEGRFLVKFAEHIAHKLLVTSISLFDVSEISCIKDSRKKETGLARLRALQTGKTWYGSLGYTSKTDQTALEIQAYPLKTISLGLAEIATSFAKSGDAHISFAMNKITFDDMVDKFESDRLMTPLSDTTIGEFFSWLWQRDCEIAVSLIDFIFVDTSTKTLKLRKIKLPKHYRKALSHQI